MARCPVCDEPGHRTTRPDGYTRVVCPTCGTFDVALALLVDGEVRNVSRWQVALARARRRGRLSSATPRITSMDMPH